MVRPFAAASCLKASALRVESPTLYGRRHDPKCTPFCAARVDLLQLEGTITGRALQEVGSRCARHTLFVPAVVVLSLEGI